MTQPRTIDAASKRLRAAMAKPAHTEFVHTAAYVLVHEVCRTVKAKPISFQDITGVVAFGHSDFQALVGDLAKLATKLGSIHVSDYLLGCAA